MLLKLVDECKQNIWEFLDAQELCRVAGVAHNAEQGVCVGPMWQQHSRVLLIRGLESLKTETGVPGCGLARSFGSRHLLLRESQDRASLDDGGYDVIDWRLWYRDTHVVLRTGSRNNTEFFRRMSSLQDLKTKRSHLKEAIQNVKASAHADKQSRQGQMNCVRWMNRTHRRLATNINSIHAQHAAMSKAELVEKLQLVENAIQDMTKEQFWLRKEAMRSMHKVKTQLAGGTKLLRDVGAHADPRSSVCRTPHNI
uniref:Uncharacterized protein n=1 Tax=Hyaloperonospora arabidopsidis (strain Emoy2) TaxID=559515 RepID=M4BAW0_HYAAE